MNPLDQLNGYLRRLERRLRTAAVTRGALMLAGVALAATVLLVAIMNALAFAGWTIVSSRLLLAAALVGAVIAGLVRPWKSLNRRRAAARAEQVFPEFEQRLVTIAERGGGGRDPFIELLAADALDVARGAEAGLVYPASRVAALALGAVTVLMFLVWLIASGPGYWGHGAKLLWAVMPRHEARAFYELKVTPGNLTVRRNSDQLITATPAGFSPRTVRLYARYASASKWETVEMRPASSGPGAAEGAFEFLFAGLTEPVEYSVQAGAVRSPPFKLNVRDLPQVRKIHVTYLFPSWTGLGSRTEDNAGDLRAVEGTAATLKIETDRPVSGGVIMVDGNRKAALEQVGPNTYRATIPIERDGLYHVAAVDQGENIRLSDDYFIEARKEHEPAVRISRPGRDYKASPIEEVAVEVTAEDDFGLREVTLHFSVNGGAEQKRSIPARAGGREASGSVLVALEDYKLIPGDLVSVYASARDARSTARTDMFFIEAQPFEKEYSQSQQMGGGGGGGQQDDNQISARQKEIIAATFNQMRDKKATKAENAEAGKFLGEVQAKLRDQAKSLAQRMRSRELTLQNQEFASFGKEMTAASEAMTAASAELTNQKWQEALPHEQKALQHLLRAEATFRQIQVAFGQRGGGGGGGGAGRDLENLFDLELDTEKNQYETGAQPQSQQSDQTRQVDEALEKLKELARRQQELAAQQRQNKQSFQQRWQQEMLRREAEQLQRQMEQMTRGESGQGRQSQSQQAQSGQQGQSGQPGSSGSSSSQQGQSGQQPGRPQQQQQAGLPRRRQQDVDPRVRQALERLRQATEDMRQAQGNQGGKDAEARRAAERLREATDTLAGMQRQDASGKLGDIAGRAERLAAEQRAQSGKLRQMYGDAQKGGQPGLNTPPGISRQQVEQLAGERAQMAEELSRLERDMQSAARSLGSSERAASHKLREALGEMQQNELGLRLKYSAQWIRGGMGAYAYLREQPVTQMLDKLSEQVREAQRLLGQNGDGKRENLQAALDRLDRMRRDLEAAGHQPGQNGQRGQQGQQGQQGQGQQAGQQGQQGRQGQRGQGGQMGQRGERGQQGGLDEFRQFGGGGNRGDSDYSAMNRGDRLPQGGNPNAGADSLQTNITGFVRDSVRDLQAMRREFEGSGEEQRDIQELIREMQRLDPAKFKGNPEMVEQLRGQVLASIEQLELQLRRKMGEDVGGAVRSDGVRPAPSGYRDAVAEYYRRLSKGK